MLDSSPFRNHGAQHTRFMHSAMLPRPLSSLWLAMYARTRITTGRTPEPLLRIKPSTPARTIPYHTSHPVSWSSLAGTTTQKYARGSSSAGAVPPSQRLKRHGLIITRWPSVCAEQADFDDPDLWERSMDDLILKAEMWKNKYWVIRSFLLKVELSGERPKDGCFYDRTAEWPVQVRHNRRQR
jgi:hypothetical protein